MSKKKVQQQGGGIETGDSSVPLPPLNFEPYERQETFASEEEADAAREATEEAKIKAKKPKKERSRVDPYEGGKSPWWAFEGPDDDD